MNTAASLAPGDADVQYGLACSRARLGLEAEALAALARSVELGNTDADHAAKDPDLRSLWNLAAFTELLDRMRPNAGA